MIFNTNFQYGGYVLVRNKREKRRKVKALQRSMLSCVPSEYLDKVIHSSFKGHPRARDPLARYDSFAWKVGPVADYTASNMLY